MLNVQQPKLKAPVSKFLVQQSEMVAMLRPIFDNKMDEANIQRVAMPSHIEGPEGDKHVHRQHISGDTKKMETVLFERTK